MKWTLASNLILQGKFFHISLLIFSASTASSSGLNSRCEDVPSTDTVDSSSREDDNSNLHSNDCNGIGPPKSEMKKVHDELERLERSGSFSSQGNGSMTAVAAPEVTPALTQNLSNPSSSISAARVGRAAIESSTDTLVDSSRCLNGVNNIEVLFC